MRKKHASSYCETQQRLMCRAAERGASRGVFARPLQLYVLVRQTLAYYWMGGLQGGRGCGGEGCVFQYNVWSLAVKSLQANIVV
jgi:hypothetical protein